MAPLPRTAPSLEQQLSAYVGELERRPLGEAHAARIVAVAAEVGVAPAARLSVVALPAPMRPARQLEGDTLRLCSLLLARATSDVVREEIERAFGDAGRFLSGAHFAIATGAKPPTRAPASHRPARPTLTVRDGGKRD